MAAKNAAKPRPNKNSDGQDKRPTPTMSRDIHIKPGPPEAPPESPDANPPGNTNPMTHPNHPMMQSSLGAGPQPGTAPMGPTAKPADNRQVQERIQFKDLNPAEQSQVASQQGLDPYAPLKMVQQGVEGAIQGGQSTGPLPNMLSGPYVPPGVEAFPDDFAHLSTLMAQGYAPGSSGQEHELGQNAHALMRAKLHQAFANAQEGTGEEQAAPYPPMQAPQGAPPGVTLAPGIPQGPPMASSMAPPPMGALPGGAPAAMGAPSGPPPSAPGAPGGIPAALIAMLLAKHKRGAQTRDLRGAGEPPPSPPATSPSVA